MKRVIIRAWFILTLACLLATACRIFPPRYAPSRLEARPAWSPPSSATSTPGEVTFSYNWTAEESESRTFAFIIPPDVTVTPVVLDYSISSIAPDGEARVMSAKEVENNSQLAGTLDLKSSVTVADAGYIRFNRIAKVELHPKIRAPEGTQSLALRSIKVALRWDAPYAPPPLRDQAIQHGDAGFGVILRHFVANPEAASLYAAPAPPEHIAPNAELTAPSDLSRYSWNTPWLKIPISEKGLYVIDADYLKSVGWEPRGINPRTVRLFRKGVEVPTLLLGGASDYFSPSDAVIFYGLTADDTRYTATNIYWLTHTGGADGLRMPTLPVPPEGVGEPAPPRGELQSPTFFTDTLTLEEDNQLEIQTGNFLSIRGMRWVWKHLLFNSPEEIRFDLPGLIRLPGEETLTIGLYINPEAFMPDTRLRVTINEQLTRDLELKTEKEMSQKVSIAHELLRPEGNTVQIALLPPEKKEPAEPSKEAQPDEKDSKRVRPSGIFLDSVTIPYPRALAFHKNQLRITTDTTSPTLRLYSILRDTGAYVLGFDLSDETSPRVLQPAETNVSDVFSFRVLEQGQRRYDFLAPSAMMRAPAARTPQWADLHSTANAADYLIISHEMFIPLLQPLIDLRTAQGFKVKLINVAAIYDEFNDGIESPEAIKAFLSYALRNWTPPLPEYVLLVGDCTSDYKDYAQYAVTSEGADRGGARLVRAPAPNAARNLLPSYSFLVGAEEKQDRWASDHWFTTIAGADEFADLLLGRISVNNVEDAQTVVDKIIRYATKPELGPWRAQIAYVADEGVFDAEEEDLRVNYTPPWLGATTIYFGRLPWEDNFYLPRDIVEAERAKVSTVTTTRILKTLDSGVSWLTFYGHGSPNIWCDERIWYGGDSKNSDNLQLRNLDRLPFIVTMTCNSGAIDYPVPRWNICISEDFMRVKQGGAIALFVPSGPGFTAVHKKISIELQRALFFNNVRRLADTIALANDRFLLDGNEPNLVRMFILLGDPALELQLPGASFPLELSQREIRRGESVTIAASATVPNMQSGRSRDLGSGKVIFSVHDGENEALVRGEEMSFSDSRVGYQFQVPADAACGKWTVRAYCWNEQTGTDAAGAAQFVVDTPYVTIKSFENVSTASETPDLPAQAGKNPPDALSPNQRVMFKAEIANGGLLPITDAHFAFTQVVRSRPLGKVEGTTRDLERKAVDFLPEETKSFDLSATLEPGINLFHFKLLDYSEPPDPATMPASGEKIIALGAPHADNAIDLALDPRLSSDPDSSGLETELHPSGSGALLTFKFPVFNLGTQQLTGARAVLGGKEGERRFSTARAIPLMRPGTQQTVSLTSTLLGRDGSLLPTSATITLEPPPGLKDLVPENNVMTFQLQPDDLSDLAISPDDISFDPESPTEGFTVFIGVRVRNVGKTAARNFSVCAYDADPRENRGEKRDLPAQAGAGSEKARMLENLVDDPAYRLAYLAAGASTNVTLRWDPLPRSDRTRVGGKPRLHGQGQAGQNTIFVRADSDNQVVEVRKDNNVASRSLKVRTKAILHPAGIGRGEQTAEQRQRNAVPLFARVRNDGETAAREVYVTFFSEEEQNEKTRLGDVLVGDIAPGETREATYLWQYTREDVGKRFRPSFQIYLKGSSQRISSTELQKPD